MVLFFCEVSTKMASISASTTHKVKRAPAAAPKTKSKSAAGGGISIGRVAGGGTKKKTTLAKKGAGSKRGIAPKLRPDALSTDDAIAQLQSLAGTDLADRISDLVHRAFGERSPFHEGISRPHTASTTAERSSAAADLATACRALGCVRVLKRHGVLAKMESMLLPMGIGAVFGNEDGTNHGGGMRKIASAVSLVSMASDDGTDGIATTATTTGSVYTGVSDSRKGKATPAEAREGGLLILRALCEIVGRPAEPYIVPLLAAALDEAASSSGSVREAAEDTAVAIVSSCHPLAISTLVVPILFEALQSPEWRVKACALERLTQCAETSPDRISPLLPEIIPKVTPQVWDTKPQVTRAASASILACCQTNVNPDIKPAIPAIRNAIVKPTDTMKAIDELKATTFVSPVDASTLSILCPILSRGLKEKQALSKRSCCVVIENMSRLVETPDAVAPFGPLLVPELKKVAENVAFEDIRDVALSALQALTKALGHSSVDEAIKSVMAEEAAAAEEEQKRIERAREEERQRAEELARKEEAERKQWKEAMEAQRLLDKLALEEEAKAKHEDIIKKDKEKRSVKGKGGKCQGCGLKKCKKTCHFYSG